MHLSILLSISHAWFANSFVLSCALLTASGLLMSLRDCGSPELDLRPGRTRPTSLRSSDRSSLLRYMGLRECGPFRTILKLIFSQPCIFSAKMHSSSLISPFSRWITLRLDPGWLGRPTRSLRSRENAPMIYWSMWVCLCDERC